MYSSIVVATDGSPAGSSALSEAARLALAFDAPLHLVRVGPSGPPPDPDRQAVATSLAGSVAAASSSAVPVAASTGDAHPSSAGDENPGVDILSRQLDAVAGRLATAGIEAAVHALTGDPAVAILKVAESQRADLIVVGNRPAADGPLAGVPRRVADHAGCAVLIVKAC